MERRPALPLLAVLLAVALAGCAHPAGMLDMDPVTDSELAERASYATSGAETYPSIDQQRTARRAIENGSLTLPAARQPVRTGLPYEYRGAYYNLTASVVDQVPGTSTLIHVDYNGSAPDATRVAFGDLSPTDREQLGPVLANEPGFLRDGPEADLPLYYTGESQDASVVLDHAGDTIAVEYRGSAYVVSVENANRDPLRIYRYETTLVAESTREYATHLTSTYAFTLSNLDDGERDVVREAIDEEYYPEDTDDASFESLVERFRGHARIEGESSHGSWLVNYDGQLYWTEMEYGGFVQDESDGSKTPNVTPH